MASRSVETGTDAPAARSIATEELQTIVAAHAEWLRSDGRAGQRADFRNARLQRPDLGGVDLRRATFVDAVLEQARLAHANLAGADLRDAELDGADLTGAILRDADLRDADLDGALLRDADFQDADLRDVRGLVSGQFGGANVSGAKLPDHIGKFDSATAVQETSKSIQNLFTSILLLCAYVWLTVMGTRDAPLMNIGAPTSARLPVLGSDIPLYHFYIVAPLLLMALDLYFRLSLQRLWEELADLPAIFPDGRPLDKRVSAWMLNGLVSLYFERLRSVRSTLAIWQARTAAVVAWGVVPFTLFIVWARYVRMHDWRVTLIHLIAIAATLGVGVGFYRLAIATLRGGTPTSHQRPGWRRLFFDIRSAGIATSLATLLMMGCLSWWMIHGILVDGMMDEAKQAAMSKSWNPRVWVPRVLATFNIRSFASIESVDISTKPAGWTGKDEELNLVKGADLGGVDLHYAQAYGAFLAKAFLRYANLRNADLREVDLRGADLRDADLSGANLRKALLRGADLRNARLVGTRMIGADVTGADFEGAVLTNADLSRIINNPTGATTTVNSRTDFSKANLTNAKLQGADLRNTLLHGANLVGADLSDVKFPVERNPNPPADLTGSTPRSPGSPGTPPPLDAKTESGNPRSTQARNPAS